MIAVFQTVWGLVPTAQAEDVRLEVQAAMGGYAGIILPDPGLSREVGLGRARIGLIAGVDPAEARFSMRGVRSGGQAGYLGVDGESVLAEIETAEAVLRREDLQIGRGELGSWRLGLGLVGVEHVAEGERRWGMLSIIGDLGRDLGWLDRSDMGGWLAWESAGRRYGARLELTSGEGARQQERNEGKDLALRLALRPLAVPEALEFSLYLRDGSTGVALARDHRFGLRICGGVDRLQASAEILQAWGVDGDSGRTPSALSGWVQARPLAPLLLVGRADLSDESLDGPEDHQIRTLLGAGISSPLATGAQWSLIAGWQREAWGAQAAPLPGSDVTQFDRLLISLDVSLDVSLGVPLGVPPGVPLDARSQSVMP